MLKVLEKNQKTQFKPSYPYSGWAFFGLLKDGWGQKRPLSLKSVTHILQWWNLAQLYHTQRRSKKFMNHVRHPLNSAGISIFSSEIRKFCYIKKQRYRLHLSTYFLILLVFLKSLKICLINQVVILMMSSKMGTLDLLKITVFWNNDYDVIISADDVQKKNRFFSRVVLVQVQ